MLPSIATDVFCTENDGMSLVDNAVQFFRIVMIQGGLDTFGSDGSNAFSTGGCFWLWVEGGAWTAQVPDFTAVFELAKFELAKENRFSLGYAPL